MEIIELTSQTIGQYLEDCLRIQTQLIKPEETPNAELFKATAADVSAYFIGLIEDEKLVGMGVVGRLVHPVHITGHIDNIVVDNDYRGRGYFTIIMDALEAKAKEWGADELTLTCSRPLVQPLYEKRNYVARDTKCYKKKIT